MHPAPVLSCVFFGYAFLCAVQGSHALSQYGARAISGRAEAEGGVVLYNMETLLSRARLILAPE